MADPRFRKLYFPDFIKTPQLSIMPDYGVLKFLYCYENLNNRVKFNSINLNFTIPKTIILWFLGCNSIFASTKCKYNQ